VLDGRAERPAGSPARAAGDGPPDIVVSLRGVDKRFGSGDAVTVALAGVDLEVGRRELVSIIGP